MKANEWNNNTKAVKQPTLLEGEALAVSLDLTKTKGQLGDYSITVGELKKKLAPSGFSLLETFHAWKLQPGEVLSLLFKI